MKTLEEISLEVQDLKRSIEDIRSAFTKDEDGNIDYSGHKQFHRTQIDSSKENKASTLAVKRQVLIWSVIGMATLLLKYFSEIVTVVINTIPKK